MRSFKICGFDGEHYSLFEYVDQQISAGKNIILLVGNLGSGKTTLVSEYLNYRFNFKAVDSPTFSIVNTYEFEDEKVNHFDLYRLESLEEIEDIAFMEFIDSRELCFIEWPEKIANFLPQDRVLALNISVSSDKCREYTVR